MPKEKKKVPSDAEILFFVIILCFTCGFLLAVIAFGLQTPQKDAKEFDQNKQMLIAAKVLSHEDTFEILEEGAVTPANFDESTKTLVAVKEGEKAEKATDDQIRLLAKLRIRPLLTDDKGDLYTLKEKNINLGEYMEKNKKAGYAKQPLKLVYAILPNSADAEKTTADDIVKDISKANMFVIPVSGFGLWAPIYGYLAVGNDGDEVIGTTWYELGETPGLGANIAEAKWQKQFFGKLVFHEGAEGKTDFTTATMGIVVVKGKVSDVYGTSSKAKSAVDGISGATLTGNGVTAAYEDSLTPYRAFLIKVHDAGEKKDE